MCFLRGCERVGVDGDAFDGVAFDAAGRGVEFAREAEAFIVLREGLCVIPSLVVRVNL